MSHSQLPKSASRSTSIGQARHHPPRPCGARGPAKLYRPGRRPLGSPKREPAAAGRPAWIRLLTLFCLRGRTRCRLGGVCYGCGDRSYTNLATIDHPFPECVDTVAKLTALARISQRGRRLSPPLACRPSMQPESGSSLCVSATPGSPVRDRSQGMRRRRWRGWAWDVREGANSGLTRPWLLPGVAGQVATRDSEPRATACACTSVADTPATAAPSSPAARASSGT